MTRPYKPADVSEAEWFVTVVDTVPVGCWLWPRSTNGDGYGKLYVDKKLVLAHRYAYELLVGPIPDGMTLDHLCRHRACVRPSHLEPVTIAENLRRGHVARGHRRRDRVQPVVTVDAMLAAVTPSGDEAA